MSPSYEKLGVTSTFHDIPRFGHTNNFASLFGDQSSQEDYIFGLVFAGAFVFAIFFSWCIALIIFKCLGQKRVGFLSGAPFQRPKDPSIDYKRPFRVRVVFTNCTFLLMIAAVLFVTKGLTNLENTVNTVSTGVKGTLDIVDAVDTHTSNLATLGQDLQRERTSFTTQVNDPNLCLRSPQLVQNVTDGVDFSASIDRLVSLLDSLEDFRASETADLSQAAGETKTTALDAEEQTDKIELDDWQSLIIMIPYTVIPAVLLLGVVLAWNGYSMTWFKCLLSWVFSPLFIVMIVFAFCLCSGMLMVAGGNADWCSGGEQRTPDASLVDSLRMKGFTEEDFTIQLIDFYLSRCAAGTPVLSFLFDFEDDLVATDGAIVEFEDLISDSSPNNELLAVCGNDELVPIATSARTLSTGVDALVENTRGALDALDCASVFAVYSSLVYDGTCTYSVAAVTWAFSSFLVVAVSGMVMITLRSAWRNVVDPPAEVDRSETRGLKDEQEQVDDENEVDDQENDDWQDEILDSHSTSTSHSAQVAR